MTHFLTACLQAVLFGVFVYALSQVLMDGLEEIGNRLLKLFRKKQIGLLTVSNAIRKP